MNWRIGLVPIAKHNLFKLLHKTYNSSYLRVNTGIPEFRNSGKFSDGKVRKMLTVISGKSEKAIFYGIMAPFWPVRSSNPFSNDKYS